MPSRPLIGVSASQHDFGDYGSVGVQRPLFAAGGLPQPGARPALCRGIQMFNVALGGTLVQDLSLVAAAHPSDPGWSHSCRGCGGSGSSCIKAS